MIDAFMYFCPRGGSQFEGDPLPFYRPGSCWLSISIFLGYLVGPPCGREIKTHKYIKCIK
jgi:hypothetical protein